MFFASQSQRRPLGNAGRSVEFGQIDELVRVFSQIILQPRDNRVDAACQR